MESSRGKRTATFFVIAGLAIGVAVTFMMSRDAVARWFRGGAREPLPVVAAAEPARVTIAAGKVSLEEFASFLEHGTGLTVLMGKGAGERVVDVKKPVPDADVEIVRELLESEGYAVEKDTLPNGRDVVRVEWLADES